MSEIVNGSTDSKRARLFTWCVQFLIVVSMVSFAIGTLPDVSPSARAWLRRVEVLTVVLFTIEYAGRLMFARNRLRFATSFFGVIDLLAILPFYVAMGVDLRAMRAVRLLRLVRILKLARYNAAVRRLGLALRLVREELVLFGGAALVYLFLAAAGIYYFENPVQPEKFSSIFESLWWAVATLTTVGYGDIYPVTVGGRVFTFFILLLGLGLVAAPCGMVSAALTEARKMDDADCS